MVTAGQATEEKRAEPSFQDPAQTVVWGGKLPSRRRAITGGLSGLAIGALPRLFVVAEAESLHHMLVGDSGESQG